MCDELCDSAMVGWILKGVVLFNFGDIGYGYTRQGQFGYFHGNSSYEWFVGVMMICSIEAGAGAGAGTGAGVWLHGTEMCTCTRIGSSRSSDMGGNVLDSGGIGARECELVLNFVLGLSDRMRLRLGRIVRSAGAGVGAGGERDSGRGAVVAE